MKYGLTSVTFRRRDWREIIRIACDCGLDGIEWGGDVHVPPGDVALARQVCQASVDARLEVLSYGSYYRLGADEDFAPVLDTALDLRAGTVRVWAGGKASVKYSPAEREAAVAEVQAIADMARPHGVTIAFEYHRNTLTDTSGSALALLSAVGRENVRTYWQPNPDLTHTQRLEGLAAVLPWLENVHVHVAERHGAQLPLEDVLPQWRDYIQALRGRARALILEFVKNEDPTQLARDAAALRSLYNNDD